MRPESDAWHEALQQGELVLGRCNSCSRFRFPPMPACPYCGTAGAGRQEPASGRGTVYSWVVVNRALDPAFADEVPYAILAVELEEGPRLFARYGGDAGSLAPGLEVRLAPARSASGEAILSFDPAA